MVICALHTMVPLRALSEAMLKALSEVLAEALSGVLSEVLSEALMHGMTSVSFANNISKLYYCSSDRVLDWCHTRMFPLLTVALNIMQVEAMENQQASV